MEGLFGKCGWSRFTQENVSQAGQAYERPCGAHGASEWHGQRLYSRYSQGNVIVRRILVSSRECGDSTERSSEKLMAPKVSICMPTYSFAHFLPEAIESVMKQSYDDYEFIIIDDCSRD